MLRAEPQDGCGSATTPPELAASVMLASPSKPGDTALTGSWQTNVDDTGSTMEGEASLSAVRLSNDVWVPGTLL